MSNSFTEATALADVLRKMASGVDERIVVKVEQHKGVWGFRLTDPWDGNFWESNWRKVRDFLWAGF